MLDWPQIFGLRWQSEAATPLSEFPQDVLKSESGVALTASRAHSIWEIPRRMRFDRVLLYLSWPTRWESAG
jgi:hypothetical protein